MAIDLYQSRRAKFNRCEFYNCLINDADLKHQKRPDGIFYAVEYSPRRGDGNNVGNVLRFDHSQITIKTEDDVEKLEVDNVVRFKGELWIVVDIQFNVFIKESEFAKYNQHGSTIISLRR